MLFTGISHPFQIDNTRFIKKKWHTTFCFLNDYVVLQKDQVQDNRLPPPLTLIMDFTMTHVRFGSSHLHPMGQLTNTRRSDGPPDPDGVLKDEVRINIRYNRNVYLNQSDPITFIPLTVDTTGHLYGDFIRLFASDLVMNCRRYRISLVSLELCVSLVWRVLLVWSWWKNLLYGLQSPWTSHLGLSCLFLVSSVRVVPHRF